jgi:MFS family permease
MENWRERWNYRYTVLLLCWFGWITIYLSRSVLAPLLPVISTELELSHTQAGMLETAYLIGYIVVKVPAGVIANKIGIKRALVIGMIGYAMATMLNFFALNFFQLFFFRFFLGLFQGVHLPLANTLLSERFGEMQGRVIGFHESGPNIGNSIAYPLAVMIASTWSWRHAFLFISLPAFILAGFVTLFLREEKEISRVSKSEAANREQKISDYMSYLIPLALAHATYNFTLRTLLTFTPSFLVEYKGMGLTNAGLLATLMPAAGLM